MKKIPMKFNNVSKTGLRTQVRQRMLEIYYFSHRNPHKLEIFNVSLGAQKGPILTFKLISSFFLNIKTQNPLKSGSETGGHHRHSQHNTNPQTKNYLFSQSPTIDNCALNTVSIYETNNSSKSSIYQSMGIEPTIFRLRIRCFPNWSIEVNLKLRVRDFLFRALLLSHKRDFRFYENYVGRAKANWSYVVPRTHHQNFSFQFKVKLLESKLNRAETYNDYDLRCVPFRP